MCFSTEVAMPTRRAFLQTGAALAFLPTPVLAEAAVSPAAAPGDDRRYWLSITDKLSRNVLTHLAAGTLRKNMPVESNGKNREQFSHLEAFARLLCGLAPWLASAPADGAERTLHQELRGLAQASVAVATDPQSADFLNFSTGGQALVDTAFLAQAILRGKSVLYSELPPQIQTRIVAALKVSRAVPAPDRNNWVLFAATVEAALLELGETPQHQRFETELKRMLSWYKGDGVYGDGEPFHFDYYNSYVIHPMLMDCLTTLARHDARYQTAADEVLRRARRYAAIQERLIAPDGSFPVVGRSITYRMGAFHHLAAVALHGALPEELHPGQVRSALTAVMRRCMEAPGTFDEKGWLRVGLAGHQPGLGETYISTGSLYLCAAALLPLGLPAGDPFWAEAGRAWTARRAWGGEDLKADHALEDAQAVVLPDPA
jgi:hypothetical protein